MRCAGGEELVRRRYNITAAAGQLVVQERGTEAKPPTTVVQGTVCQATLDLEAGSWLLAERVQWGADGTRWLMGTADTS